MSPGSRICWPEVARRLAAQLARERLHPAVLAWTAERVRSRRWWGVACSGGADSLALLLLLWAHWPERRDRLLVLHFNHRLRGRAAAADARFCARVARALEVEFQTGAWEAPVRASSEGAARTARQAFFAQELRRRRAAALWLGHQQDDVAETMLMRLARGSGTAGLAAPRPIHAQAGGWVHLRPLLDLSARELREALKEAGATWREDASNQTDLFFRNRLRRAVLPAWVRAAGRDALAGAALSRQRLEEDDVALEQILDRLDPIGADRSLDLGVLAGQPVALWRRALHRWLLLQPHQSDLSRHGFEVLLSKAQAGNPSRFSLGLRGFAQIRSGRIHFICR